MRTLSLACMLLLPSSVWAQGNGAPPSPDDIDKDVAIIPYKNGEPFKGGRLVYIDGVSDKDRDVRFGLEGLAITQPVTVSVLTQNPKQALRLKAVKWGGATAGKQAETDSRGVASIAFRAQGDAQLAVRGLGEKTPFQLMVWVGPELKPPLKAPFVSSKPEALRSAQGDR